MVNDASDWYISIKPSKRSALVLRNRQQESTHNCLSASEDTWAAVVQTIGRDDALVSKRG